MDICGLERTTGVQIQYTCGVYLGLQLYPTMHPNICPCVQSHDFSKVVLSNVNSSRFKLMFFMGMVYIRVRIINLFPFWISIL